MTLPPPSLTMTTGRLRSTVARLTQAERKRARRRAVNAALLGYRNRAAIHYTQSSARWSGIDNGQNAARGEFPRYADCSSFSTWCLWNALQLLYRKPDVVNGARWRAGYTGTQVAHGRRVSPSRMMLGDLVFYAGSGSTPTHVAIAVGKRDGRMMVVSHGSESGPLYVPWNYRRVVQCRRFIHTGV